MIERWKVIKGWPMYEVSSLGRVRSWKNARWGRSSTPKLLRPGKVDGYPIITLHANGKQTSRRISHLVAEAFIGARPNGLQVCHEDNNRANNNFRNLRYDTPKGNCADKVRHGTLLMGERQPRSKLTEKQVYEIRRLLAKGRTQISIARRFNVTPMAINDIRHRRNWKHLIEDEY